MSVGDEDGEAIERGLRRERDEVERVEAGEEVDKDRLRTVCRVTCKPEADECCHAQTPKSQVNTSTRGRDSILTAI